MKTLLGLMLTALAVGLLEAWTVLQERIPAGWPSAGSSVAGPARAGGGWQCAKREASGQSRPSAPPQAEAARGAREGAWPRIGGQDWLRSIVRVDL